MDSGAFTVVQIPVREAEGIVRMRSLRMRSAPLPKDRSIAAHITVLGPFMPAERIDDGVLGELERYFADVTSFGFNLSDVCQFPAGPAYLAPEPAAVFRRLTLGLHRLFPEFAPYGGEFDEVVPHLSVPLAPGEDAEALRAELGHVLPIQAHAVEATLVSHAEDGSRTLATFGFGTTAA
ncbi:MAG: 2'-5' RNA ligase family protein [Actinomycetota bacterium]|nr:2'-5' RNA ligase family protein [Actinomycetota bacterium]